MKLNLGASKQTAEDNLEGCVLRIAQIIIISFWLSSAMCLSYVINLNLRLLTHVHDDDFYREC
ncbi:TPA: hypothetical protein JBI12_09810 [Legionella pneumophila]|nr:hypothetical protein [Legionella pneumophila]